MPHEFLNPGCEVEMHGSDLPHWQQGEALQFVTFRLKDSLPQAKLLEWKKSASYMAAKTSEALR